MCWGARRLEGHTHLFVLIAGSILWLLWPLLRPALNSARGTTLVVVLDGYHRLDAALTRTGTVLLVSDSHHLPRLLPAARLALGGQGLSLAGLTASSALPAPASWPI